MIKKKVLVQGSLQTLQNFFTSKFNVEFELLGILTDTTSKRTLSAILTGGVRNLRFLRWKHFRA